MKKLITLVIVLFIGIVPCMASDVIIHSPFKQSGTDVSLSAPNSVDTVTLDAYLTATGTYAPLVVNAIVSEAAGITKGKVVYVSGQSGGTITVSLADNQVEAKSDVLGVAGETKANGETIKIIGRGLLTGLNTTGYTSGDILHLITAGGYQATVPMGAHINVGIVVTVDGSAGSIYVLASPYVSDIKAAYDADITLATGSDDSTRKILFKNRSGTELISINGAGDMFFNSTAMQINGSTGSVAIEGAYDANTALKITTTKRYGINFTQTYSSANPYPSALSITFSSNHGSQGTGASFQAYSTGTTAAYDYLTGFLINSIQQRNVSLSGMRTQGLAILSLNDNNSNSSFNRGDFYGISAAAGMGAGSGGTGTQTASSIVGMIAGVIKNGPSAGTFVATEAIGVSIPTFIDWAGAGTFTITSMIGLKIADQDRGTNNTNMVIGTGTTGTWNIYSSSTRDSYFAGNMRIGGGSNIVYRCSVAGAAPLGTLTIDQTQCGTAVDTGIRVK